MSDLLIRTRRSGYQDLRNLSFLENFTEEKFHEKQLTLNTQLDDDDHNDDDDNNDEVNMYACMMYG